MSTGFELRGHVAVVTGGNRGIGLGIATQLALAGASIAVWGRDLDANEAAVGELSRHGSAVRGYGCDVTVEDEVEAAMQATLRDLGPVHSFFANAGIAGNGAPFAETTLEDWRSVLSVNLDGVFISLRSAARAMIAAEQGGSLIATSSVSTIHGAANGAHYAASKGALMALVKALAVELARYEIRANAIVPGWIEIDRTADTLSDPRFQQRVLKRVPLRRWGTPNDVGSAAVYLAGPGSAYVTGTSILVDGGYTVF